VTGQASFSAHSRPMIVHDKLPAGLQLRHQSHEFCEFSFCGAHTVLCLFRHSTEFNEQHCFAARPLYCIAAFRLKFRRCERYMAPCDAAYGTCRRKRLSRKDKTLTVFPYFVSPSPRPDLLRTAGPQYQSAAGDMQEATCLVRTGRVTEATALIQRLLGPASRSDSVAQEPPWRMSDPRRN
jgi:hypothetical protein